MICFPREDVAMGLMEPSSRTSACPWKGQASHCSIQTKSTLLKDAVWSHEAPMAGMERIAGYLAFSPDKATVEALM